MDVNCCCTEVSEGGGWKAGVRQERWQSLAGALREVPAVLQEHALICLERKCRFLSEYYISQAQLEPRRSWDLGLSHNISRSSLQGDFCSVKPNKEPVLNGSGFSGVSTGTTSCVFLINKRSSWLCLNSSDCAVRGRNAARHARWHQRGGGVTQPVNDWHQLDYPEHSALTQTLGYSDCLEIIRKCSYFSF